MRGSQNVPLFPTHPSLARFTTFLRMALREADSGKFYLYSSTAENRQQPNQVLDANTTSDEFVDKLANKVIILTQKPNSNAALHQDDEWAKWLRVLDQNGQFTLTMAKDKAEIEHFELFFQGPIPLIFSTKKEALTNAFGSDASGISPPGYDAPLLCAGLVKPSGNPVAEVEFVKVWTFSGLRPETLDRSLQGLTVSMDWSLPQSHRNALWFDPEFGSQITIRLAMSLAREDLNELNKLIHSDSIKMSITKAEVVSKKILTAADTGKKKLPVNEGDALLGLECKLNGNLDLRGCMKFNDTLIDLTLQTDTTDAVAKLIAWLGTVIWSDDNKLKPMENLLHQEPFDSQPVNFRRFQLTLDISGNDVKVLSFRVDFQAATSIGQTSKGPASVKTLFLLTYTWRRMKRSTSLGTIRGQLWERKLL